jgi:SAM-dependent methyltransferase
MNWHIHNIKAYNDSAHNLAAYYSSIEPRIADIELGLKLTDNTNNIRVIEIGCGDGRDAIEIIKRVNFYEGFDPSSKLLDIASKKAPKASFVVADALSYIYPQDIDVVYAFASLLHVPKKHLSIVFDKIEQSLRKNGIVYISLKERRLYTKEIKDDKFGKRMFYYYNPQIIKKIAGKKFSSVYESHQTIGKTDWFTIALKKI